MPSLEEVTLIKPTKRAIAMEEHHHHGGTLHGVDAITIEIDNGAGSTVLPASRAITAGSPKEKPLNRVKNGQNKVLFLDGVRGLASMLVVTQHSGFMHDINLGACAVDVFFVLSSFLLTMIVEKKSRQMIEEHADRRKWFYFLADYFSKRFFRVYPLFALTAVALWLMPHDAKTKYFKIAKPEDFDLIKVLLFSFQYRYHVFWTLPVEIGYYFLIPGIVYLSLRLRRYWWVPCLPLYYWILHTGMFAYRTSHAPLANHITTFLAGSLAAIVYANADLAIRKHNFQFRRLHTIVVRAVEYTAIGLLLSVAFRGLIFHWVVENPVPQTKGFPFVSFLATIVILAEMLLPSAVSKVLEWNVLRYSGKISFSMYLLHSFVVYHDWIKRQSYYDRLFGQFALIFLLATVSYHAVEFQTQKISNSVSKRLLSRAIAS